MPDLLQSSHHPLTPRVLREVYAAICLHVMSQTFQQRLGHGRDGRHIAGLAKAS